MIVEQWTLLRRYWREGFAAAAARTAVAFLILLFIGFALSLFFPSLLERVLSYFYSYLSEGEILTESGGLSAAGLFRNNLTACFFAIAYGLIPFFYLPAATLGINAMLIGFVGGYFAANHLSPVLFIAALLPHGIFELPALILAFSAGLELCREITGRCRGQEGSLPLVQSLSNAGRIYLFPILPLLAVAAVMEAYVTPYVISLFL